MSCSLPLFYLLARPERAVGVVAVVANEMFLLVGDVVHKQPQPYQCQHELVVAFKRGVQFGAIDDHAGLLIIAHLVECKRAANHVAGHALASFGIGGLAADAVVQWSSAAVLRQWLRSTNQLLSIGLREICGRSSPARSACRRHRIGQCVGRKTRISQTG